MLNRVSILALCSILTVASCMPSLPDNTNPERTIWLDQNWSGAERHWFHHATQGTSTLPVPYDWFIALEQPKLWFSGKPPMLKDQAFLQRFGFIPSTADANYGDSDTTRKYGSAATYDEAYFPGNDDALPVGFAKTPGYDDPTTGKPLPDQIGFTCAACHTGQLDYNGVSLRIDGAPAMTDLGKFRETISKAIFFTNYVPGRFDRFARLVLGDDYNPTTKKELSVQFSDLFERGKKFKALTDPIDSKSVEEGFGRLDAINRIGNQVFFTDFGAPPDLIENYKPSNAPVNFPPIWGTSWFDWVQYDASIMQPMVRNAGEALGVSAKINLTNQDRTLYDSSVQFREIDAMERLLAGDSPTEGKPGFKGLRAPVWPENILGKINEKKKDEGRALYQDHCAKCHLPPVDDPDGRFWDEKYWWTPEGATSLYLRVPRIPLEKIGTDPRQAQILFDRKVKLPDYLEIDPGKLCVGSSSGVETDVVFGQALAVVVEKAADVWYDKNDISEEERTRMNGNRPNCLNTPPPPLGYKARPLDGIWATAPFLHNGSVPNLWALLSPIAEGHRPEKFCVGSRNFDPKHVGFEFKRGEKGCGEGLFEMNTTIEGNLNTGHEFAGDGTGDGVIGKELTPDERLALIEFLKSTPSY